MQRLVGWFSIIVFITCFSRRSDSVMSWVTGYQRCQWERGLHWKCSGFCHSPGFDLYEYQCRTPPSASKVYSG